MNLYLKEINSPLEIFEYKNIVKKIYCIKNRILKSVLKKLAKIIIKLNYEIYYLTGSIKVKPAQNHILCLVPMKINNKKEFNNNRNNNNDYNKNNNDKKDNNKSKKNNNDKTIKSKCIQNINYIVKKEKIDNIIISKNLKDIDIINKFFSNDNEVEGKYLLKIMIADVIKYICGKKNERIESKTLHILVNEYTKLNLEFIEQLAGSTKSVNIVTNNLKKFLIFSNRLYENKGVMITVSNNKRKALSRAELIINVDFSEETLKKYGINRTATFINLVEGKVNISKGFSGIIINGLSIKNIENKKVYIINDYKLFNKTILYESVFYSGYNLTYAKEKIKQDNVEIQNLIGNNGIVTV